MGFLEWGSRDKKNIYFEHPHPKLHKNVIPHVGHCKDTWWLGTARHLVFGHCRDTWWLGTAGILGG